MSDVDINQVIAKASVEAVKDSLQSLYDPISKTIKISRAKFIEDFSSYFEYIYDKTISVRTLFSKNKPCCLDDIYVRNNFQIDSKKITDEEVIDNVQNAQRIIIKGSGGSGKTFFLKYLWQHLFRGSKNKIPIFIELRRISHLSKLDLITFIRAELRSSIVSDDAIFKTLCNDGRFIFILDGFDEVEREQRQNVERQIIDLSENYKNCGLVVSGREDERFYSWGNFAIYNVLPFGLSEVRSLIEKIDFDARVKKNFLQLLNEKFFKQHKSFLSNPLLAILMLMSYHENASIPSKLNTFYEQAFQTLLTWHDATKDSFERDRCLDVDEFRRVFATFCLFSYYQQCYEFEEQNFRSLIQKSLEYHKLNQPIDEVKQDFCESVNLIQRDGLKYVFVHRSFQEYFAAYCAMHLISGKANKLLPVFANRSTDSVFRMCYDIHPELVIDEYIQPLYDRFNSENIFDIDPKAGKFNSISKISPEFKVVVEKDEYDSWSIESAPGREYVTFLDSIDCLMPIERRTKDISAGQKYPHIAIADSIFFYIFNLSIHVINNKLKLDDKKDGTTHLVEIGAKIYPDEIQVELNFKKGKAIDTAKLKSAKAYLYNTLDSELSEMEKNIIKLLIRVKEFCEEIKNDRNNKDVALDEILDL